MKKKLLLFVLLCTSLSLFAQEKEERTFGKTTFGIKAGLDHTMVINSQKAVNSVDFYAGLFAETSLSRKLSLQYEMRYSSYGNNYFVEIPLLLKYHFNDKFSMTLGPRMDFLTNDRAGARNFSMAAEIGAQYNITKQFFLDASYSVGFENQIVINPIRTGSRNNLRFGIGYKF